MIAKDAHALMLRACDLCDVKWQMGFLDVIKERDYPELSRCIFKSREFCPTRNKANEAEGDVKEI